jgi:curli biogenesis system outer membrane secretion channel CsgG
MGRNFLLALIACSLLSAGSAFAAAQPARGTIIQAPIPAVPGPKRTIAVGDIDAIGPLAGGPNGWNVGGSVSAMLATALIESGRFIVVERAALSPILTEQQLAAKGVSAGNAAPATGNVVPAQYLVVGSVTEFGATNSGNGLSLGGPTGGLTSALSLNTTKGAVAIDLRIVNTRSTAVEASFRVKREVSTTGVGLTTNYKGIALGGNQFWSTPLGTATRQAMNDAAQRIAETLARGQWEGQVVEIEGRTVYVNAGAAAGLKPGDQLQVQHTVRTFTDPATGALLSERKAMLGTIQLTNVEEKLATGTYTAVEPVQPVRGDLVVFKN